MARQIAATDVTGALGFSPVGTPGGASGLTRSGILIPYYVYVSNPYNDTNFSNLLTQIRTHPNVPCIVVVNQAGSDGNGGPGPLYDAAVAQMIRMLTAAGAIVCGYVSTVNGTRAQSLVKADIALWNALYAPGGTPLAGLFFDQSPYDPGTGNANVLLYEGYYNYARGLGYSPIIINPGSPLASTWYSAPVADIFVCYENTSWPTPGSYSIAPPQYYSGTTTDYLLDKFSMLIYNQAWNQSAYDALTPYFGWIYATDIPSPASLASPWSALPSYLGKLFDAAASSNSRTFTQLNLGSSTGPNISSGTGVPGDTQPAGSIRIRTDGTTGARLYISAGGGTWNAISGV